MSVNPINNEILATPPWAGRFSHKIARNRHAIGDVHGCSRTLQAMVEDVIKLGKDDILYLLGDYIDRGPDSKGVLDYLIHLREEDYDFRPLMGNHERMCLDAVSDPDNCTLWFNNGGWGTLHEFGVETPADIPKRYLDLMAGMPRVATTTDYVFAHAGLDFSTDNPITDTSQQFMLWERNQRFQPGKLGGRTLVHGHSVTELFEIRASLEKPIICLDNGCYDKGHLGFGNLVALNLDTRELLIKENCE